MTARRTTGEPHAVEPRATTGTPKRAAVYVRISSDPTGQRAGVERQREDTAALAARLGWTVAETYEDNDVSASKGKPRPAHSRMLADLRSGHRDGLIVYTVDRLTRRLTELTGFLDLQRQVGFAFVTTEGDNTATANGRMILGIKGVMAQQEAERLGDRVSRAVQQRVARGDPPTGGRRPYGFESDRKTVRESEAAVIRAAVDRLLDGASMVSLIRWLNESGVSTATGANQWTVSGLRDVLTSARIAGLVEHRGSIVGPGSWVPIIDRDRWERVRSLLDLRRTGGGESRRWLLSPILRCGACGARMVGSVTNYRCNKQLGCGRVSRRRERLEAFVLDRWAEHRTEITGSAVLWQDVQKAEDADRRAERAEVERRIERLRRAYGTGEIADEDYFPVVKTLRTRLGEIDAPPSVPRQTATSALRRFAEAGIPPSEIEAIGLDWLSGFHALLTPDEQRALLRSEIEVILVKPVTVRGTHQFDPDTIEIVWRR